MTDSKFERGFVFDTNITSFFYYIVGYRKSDFDLVLVQIDNELKERSEAYHVNMNNDLKVSHVSQSTED